MDLKHVINSLKIKRIFPKDGKNPFFDAKNSDVGSSVRKLRKKRNLKTPSNKNKASETVVRFRSLI
ncbi:halo peroxidase [Ligilactobacillus ruminis]|nr:halo peroxidase [Ligilactobacillus ruminis]